MTKRKNRTIGNAPKSAKGLVNSTVIVDFSRQDNFGDVIVKKSVAQKP